MGNIVKEFIETFENKSEEYEYWGDVESFDLDSPFPLPLISKPESQNWRFSIPFDDWNVDFWFSDSTALFFGHLEFSSNEKILVEVCPSMGERQQYESGLIGAGSITVPVRSYKKKRLDGSTYESESLKIAFGGVDPIWSKSGSELPYRYQDDLEESSLKWDEAISMKFPAGFNTPKVLWGCESISYALGFCSLVHGFRSMINNIPEFNAYLETKTI
jgi:hypothetical protein